MVDKVGGTHVQIGAAPGIFVDIKVLLILGVSDVLLLGVELCNLLELHFDIVYGFTSGPIELE